MLKVNDTNKSKELTSNKATRKVGGESFSTFLNQTIENTPKQIGPASGISVTDAIFATQMVEDEEKRKIKIKLIKRGQKLIEKLEDIRESLLVGYVSKDELINISRLIKDTSTPTDDQRLQDLMQEIELRVEVELAKLMK